MSVLSPSKATLLVLMLIQISLQIPQVSGEIDSATNSVESLFDRAQGIQVGASILATAAIIVGGVMVVFGFRLIRATLFVIGIVAGGVAIAMVAERMFADESWAILASWIAFAVGGLICGGLVTWLYPLSTFVAGAAAGILTAFIVTTSFGNMIYAGHTQDLFTLMCFVLGFLFGVLTLKFGKPIIIVTTSLFGAGLVVWGVGYFAGDFPSADSLESYVSQSIDGETVYSIPPAWWGYLSGLLVLFVFGMFIQFRKTARNITEDRPIGFGRRVDVATYVEKKTQRESNRDSPVMEAPPPRRQRPVRREKEVREQRQPRQVREEKTPHSKRTKSKSVKQAPSSPHQQWANLDAQDEIVYYEEQVPEQQHHRIIHDRESDLYDFESNRDPCRTCGDYVHKNGSCCSESEARTRRR